jgi:glycine/D-amino acid oxidase-like deaminating enzyme
LRTTADAVIIGGGVMGASIAYHLSEKGFTNVVLLERKALAAEGTGHSGAIVRIEPVSSLNGAFVASSSRGRVSEAVAPENLC